MDPLLQHAIDGDDSARNELAVRCEPALRRFVSARVGRKLRRESDLEDIIQETFLRVFRSLASLPEDAGIDTFRSRLFRNADWVLRDRGLRARNFAGESAVSPDGVKDAEASLHEIGDVTQDDLNQWIRRLASRVDPKYGDVLRLRLEDRSFAEIAQTLGESEGTIRKRYSRAYDALRRIVLGKGGDE